MTEKMLNHNFSIFIKDKKDNYVNFGNFSQLEVLQDSNSYFFSAGHISHEIVTHSKVPVGDLLIKLLDNNGKEVSILDGVVEEIDISKAGNDLSVIMNGSGLPLIRNEEVNIWKDRFTAFPKTTGLWRNDCFERKKAWLNVSLLDKRKKIASNKKDVEIDGKDIPDITSFYCAFGEAVFGPGGYAGKSLDALEDCLTGALDVQLPMNLVWKHSSESLNAIKSNGDYEQFETLQKIFDKHGVNLNLS